MTKRWRHLKRNSTYTEIGRGEVQSSRPVVEGDTLVAYQADDGGKLWFRLPEEFDDGRFVRIEDEAPPPEHPAKAVLRKFEWSASEDFWRACPVCKAVRLYGSKHKGDCELAAAIGGRT